MALTQSAPAGAVARAWSDGPIKKQVVLIAATSGTTSGTITFDMLHSIDLVKVNGLVQTAQPSISGNVATIACADPLASVVGTAEAWGR